MSKLFKQGFLIIIATSFLTLTSCACFRPSEYKTKITISPDIEHGSVEVINLNRPVEDTLTRDVLKIIPKAEKGYKLDTLTINGEDIKDYNKVKLNKSKEFKIDATFTTFNETTYVGGFDQNNKTTYETVLSTSLEPTIPNEGNSKILVVPVEYDDVSSFTRKELQNINGCFNGNKSDGSNDYWESVKSFYDKSSYGNVNLDFIMTDTYKARMTSDTFVRLEANDDGKATRRLLNEMYDKLTIKGQKIDYSNYDSNKDGYVDGVWLIHNYRDKKGVFQDNKFWAYCFVNFTAQPNFEKPTFGRYANCSQAFMYNSEPTSIQYGNDAHTLIHETGHMFGLDDYYSYDETIINNKKVQLIGATGGMDMMDLNIGDHNAFSKFSLGWVNPHKVTEDTDIYLKPFKENGDCVVIPVNPNISSAFNEYIILEYYTPDNLNELDSHTQYNGVYPLVYDRPGIKMFHVNSYLQDTNLKFAGDNYPNLVTYDKFDKTKQVRVALSNTASRNHYATEKDGKHNLIEAITPDNIRTYNGNYFLGTRNNKEDIRGLFEIGDIFNYKSCSNFFNNGKYLNNVSYDFPYSIRVENLFNECAAISIKKIS